MFALSSNIREKATRSQRAEWSLCRKPQHVECGSFNWKPKKKKNFYRKHWVRPWERWEVRFEPSTKHSNICCTIDSWVEYIKPEDCVIIHLEPTVPKVNTLRRRRNRTACDNRATPRCAPVNDQSPGPATGTLPGETFEMSFCSHKNQWLDYDPWSTVWWYFI